MRNIEKTFEDLDILKKSGWEYRYKVDEKMKEGGKILIGEEFLKHKGNKVFEITINRAIEDYESEKNPFEFKTTENKVAPVTAWRVDFWIVDKEKNELYHQGDYQTSGFDAYLKVLGLAVDVMKKLR